MGHLAEILLLLGASVFIVVAFQRARIPPSLGYLLVGVLLGPHTGGPQIEFEQIRVIAEFGIVFLLFTIGLNFSLPQLHALRGQVFGLGTGQVVLTTAAVGIGAWLIGLPGATAFVIGAIFAQSSTTIIGKQLAEQGEENSRHGRLGLAMSVFQDVTAVPFVVVIPVLGAAVGMEAIVSSLGWALAKAVLALALVIVAGRWLLRPMFHIVAEQRSAEVFTLTVLLVALAAAWATHSLGLSLAFGAFLAGMMLGETEFRHQVESTIRPFRDVLLGLFFVGIGMLFDPSVLPAIWHWALLGAVALLVIKALVVLLLVCRFGIDTPTAWRIALLLAVGGEFGFALLALGLHAGVIDEALGQIALSAVLFSMIAGPFLIRYNGAIAKRLSSVAPAAVVQTGVPTLQPQTAAQLDGHVIICGYGRVGQSVGNFLEEEALPFIAVDLDPVRVREAHTAGEPVFYGDAGERGILDALGVERARLVVISHDDTAAALKALQQLRRLRPELPVMVRTRDETHVEALQNAGALEVVPETLEASLMIASQTLLLLDVPLSRVLRRIQQQRSNRYRLMREFFRGDELSEGEEERDVQRLRAIVVPPGSAAAGRRLDGLDLGPVTVTALVRSGERQANPPPETRLQAGDVVVVFGSLEHIAVAESRLAR